MQDAEKELLSTYRAEAASLFAANQAGRTAAERVVAVIISITAITVAAGVNAENDDVALALPPIVLMLVAYMFNQYADVTVLGKTRRLIEERVLEILGHPALLYETVVSDVRKHGRLLLGVRMLQALTVVVVLGVVAIGTVVAFQDHVWYLYVGYGVGTVGALVTAGAAYIGMRDSNRADNAIAAQLRSLE